jgi:hypothetical protein
MGGEGNCGNIPFREVNSSQYQVEITKPHSVYFE